MGPTQGQAAGYASPSRIITHHGGLTTRYDSLYVGSLNFALTESDIRQVFQPFGAVELVDLHKDPVTGKSKGFAFVQSVQPFPFPFLSLISRDQVPRSEGCYRGAAKDEQLQLGWSRGPFFPSPASNLADSRFCRSKWEWSPSEPERWVAVAEEEVVVDLTPVDKIPRRWTTVPVRLHLLSSVLTKLKLVRGNRR